jgi:hypothetical protein
VLALLPAAPLLAGGVPSGRALGLLALAAGLGVTQAVQAPLALASLRPGPPPAGASVRPAAEVFRGDLAVGAGLLAIGAILLLAVVSVLDPAAIGGRPAGSVLLATWGAYNAAAALGAPVALRRVRAIEQERGVRLVDDWTGARSRLLRSPARARFYAERTAARPRRSARSPGSRRSR